MKIFAANLTLFLLTSLPLGREQVIGKGGKSEVCGELARSPEGGGDSANGGGFLVNKKTDLKISRCEFKNNQADEDDSRVYILNSGGIVVEHSICHDNRAGFYGGAVRVDSSLGVEVITSLFYNNTATAGGAVMVQDTVSFNVRNSTFSENKAVSLGGALVTTVARSIIDSILWGDSAPYNPEIYFSATPPQITYCDIGQSDPAWDTNPGVINLDPVFVAGPDRDFYLEPATSPWVDAGSDTAAHLSLDNMTTDPASVLDAGAVDRGYHSPPLP